MSIPISNGHPPQILFIFDFPVSVRVDDDICSNTFRIVGQNFRFADKL